MTRFGPVGLMFLLAANALSCHAASETWRDPLSGVEFVAIPKGCFLMGTDERMRPSGSQIWRALSYRGSMSDDERPAHRVCLDRFWIARHELRAAEWYLMMGETPPAGAGDQPAGGLSWNDAQRLIEKMNAMSNGAEKFRLPTEAEWEYACRAGEAKDKQPSPYLRFDPRQVARFGSLETPFAAIAVGQLQANAWGLHDMLGNLWEWVDDPYRKDAYAQHALYNPRTKKLLPAPERVMRGGSYRSQQQHIRCGNRGYYAAASALPQFGMRLVRVNPTSGQKK